MVVGQVKPGTHIRFRLDGGHQGQAQRSERQAGPQREDKSKVKPGSHLMGPGGGML